MNAEDERLKELAIEIQASTDRRNPKTRIQIDRLLSGLANSGQFKGKIADLNAKWSGIKDIRSIVAEAANNRLLEIATNIDKYDPAYSFTY